MKKILVFCFAALMFAACSERNVPIEKEAVKAGFPYTITATIAGCDQTPAVRADFVNPDPADPKKATWSVKWSVGDSVHVFNQVGAGKTVAYIVSSVDGGKATLVLKDGEDVSKFCDSTTFYAGKTIVSKSSNHAYLNDFTDGKPLGGGGINIGLGSQKCILENSIDNGFCNLVAKASLVDGKLNFNFFPAVSYLRLTVPEGLGYDIGCFYFRSGTIDGEGNWTAQTKGGAWSLSGFYRTRMRSDVDSVKVYGQRYEGGSQNAPFYYGTGTTQPSKPYPAFVPGVYYFPIVTGAVCNHLVIQDLQGAEIRSVTFESPAMAAGHIYDLGTIPTPDAAFTAGAKLYVGGEGVDPVDADHHMSYLPEMNYNPDRTVSSAFSDFCSWKIDQGVNFRSEFFNHWTMYNEAADPENAATEDRWTSYFDYEIFVKLKADKDVFLFSKTAGGDPAVYVAIDRHYTWKADSPNDESAKADAIASHVGGKCSVAFKSAPVAFKVPEDGVYRIRFSSVTKEAYVSLTSGARLRVWGPNGNNTWLLNYDGHGVWSRTFVKGTDAFTNGNAKKGSGYKFLLFGFDQDQPYGAQYPQGATQVFATDPTDVNNSLVPVQGGGWYADPNMGLNGTFSTSSLNFDNNNKTSTVATLYLNDKYGFYTHTMVVE